MFFIGKSCKIYRDHKNQIYIYMYIYIYTFSGCWLTARVLLLSSTPWTGTASIGNCLVIGLQIIDNQFNIYLGEGVNWEYEHKWFDGGIPKKDFGFSGRRGSWRRRRKGRGKTRLKQCQCSDRCILYLNLYLHMYLRMYLYLYSILTYWKYFKTPFKWTQNSGEPCGEKGEQAEKGEIVAAARKVSADHIKSFLKKHRGNLWTNLYLYRDKSENPTFIKRSFSSICIYILVVWFHTFDAISLQSESWCFSLLKGEYQEKRLNKQTGFKN